MVLPLLILGAIVLKNALVFANHGVVSRMFADVGADLRARLFDRLLAMRWESFERADAGTLLTLLATESWRAAQAVQLCSRSSSTCARSPCSWPCCWPSRGG